MNTTCFYCFIGLIVHIGLIVLYKKRPKIGYLWVAFRVLVGGISGTCGWHTFRILLIINALRGCFALYIFIYFVKDIYGVFC